MADEPENKLAVREQQSLEEWKKGSKGVPLPLAKAVKLYELYLNGYTCEEIFRVNGGRIPLGQIVDARERYEWQARKEAQLQSIYGNIEEKVLKTKNDAIVHVSDMLAVAHKVWGDKLKTFLQEGDPSVLGTTDFANMKLYKELLQMLQVLTNAKEAESAKKDVQIGGTVNHLHTVVKTKQMSGHDASELLKMIEDGDIVDA